WSPRSLKPPLRPLPSHYRRRRVSRARRTGVKSPGLPSRIPGTQDSYCSDFFCAPRDTPYSRLFHDATDSDYIARSAKASEQKAVSRRSRRDKRSFANLRLGQPQAQPLFSASEKPAELG